MDKWNSLKAPTLMSDEGTKTSFPMKFTFKRNTVQCCGQWLVCMPIFDVRMTSLRRWDNYKPSPASTWAAASSLFTTFSRSIEYALLIFARVSYNTHTYVVNVDGFDHRNWVCWSV